MTRLRALAGDVLLTGFVVGVVVVGWAVRRLVMKPGAR